MRNSAIWLTRHWLPLANALLLAFVALPVLEPLLRAGSIYGSAGAIWSAYSYVCHQLPSHSYYLAGFQMAFCERDTAIYASMALGGLAWARCNRSLPRLHWGAFVLLALPMALDGFSQVLGWRESTWALRTVTGVLFGTGCIWFGFPLVNTTAKLVRIALKATYRPPRRLMLVAVT